MGCRAALPYAANPRVCATPRLLYPLTPPPRSQPCQEGRLIRRHLQQEHNHVVPLIVEVFGGIA